jgi:tetratricopeptide (TPR) repeat protein
MGDVCMWKGDHRRAVSSYRRALELEPGSVETALDLASAYEAAGQDEQARDAVRQALRQAPDNRKALELLQKLRRARQWNAPQVWRAGLEALTHAGLPLTLAFVFHHRRRLVRYRPRLYRLVYRGLLPGLALAWVAAFIAEAALGDSLYLRLVEPLIFVSLGLALSSRLWETGPALGPERRAVLAVGAHPDDFELGAGGLLLRLKEEGAPVYGLVMSEGEKGIPERGWRPAGSASTGSGCWTSRTPASGTTSPTCATPSRPRSRSWAWAWSSPTASGRPTVITWRSSRPPRKPPGGAP